MSSHPRLQRTTLLPPCRVLVLCRTRAVQVAEKQHRTMARGVVRESDDVIRAKRQQQREAAAADDEGAGAWAQALFEDGEREEDGEGSGEESGEGRGQSGEEERE